MEISVKQLSGEENVNDKMDILESKIEVTETWKEN